MVAKKKYTVEERQIARKIWNLTRVNKVRRQKYLDADVKINYLKCLLGGKYNGKG